MTVVISLMIIAILAISAFFHECVDYVALSCHYPTCLARCGDDDDDDHADNNDIIL